MKAWVIQRVSDFVEDSAFVGVMLHEPSQLQRLVWEREFAGTELCHLLVNEMEVLE